MSGDREERIKAEAYRRWETEGRPDGAHERHWHEAAGEVDRPADVKPQAAKKEAVKKAPAKKPAAKAIEPVAEAKPKKPRTVKKMAAE